MKRKALIILAAILSIAFTLTACATPTATTAPSATAVPTAGPAFTEGKLIYYVFGDEYADAATVYAEVNKTVQEKLNTTIEFKTVSYDNYNVLMSSGESFDLIGVADWMGFWDFASKGAFADLTDALITKNCPAIMAKYATGLNVNKLGGKRFAIPNFGTNVNTNVWIARGDLMDKYALKSVSSLDEVEAYLTAVAANEKDIIPWAVNNMWSVPALFIATMGWQAPGPANCTSPVQIDILKGDYKGFDIMDRPETLAFAKRMKTWADKGFWSKSALSSPTGDEEAFKQGKSALMGANLDTANNIFTEFSKDERKAWDIRIFNMYPTFTAPVSTNGSGIAVSSGSKEIDRALAVIDLLKTDATLNHLMMHGIENVHYKVLADKSREILDGTGYNWTGNGLDNADLYLTVGGGFPTSAAMLATLKANLKPNKLVDFSIDTKPVEQQATALSDAYSQYAGPLFLGLVDDVDAAFNEYKQKKIDAGQAAFAVEVQKQIDAFVAAR